MSDWTGVTLGTTGRLTNGINKSASDFGFGVPFVNLLDVFGVTSLTEYPSGLVNASEDEIRRYDLRIGDVLFIRSSVKPSGVGLTSVVLHDFDRTVFSGFIIRFRPNADEFVSEFLKYIFHAAAFRRQLLAKSTVSANTNINQESLSSLHIDVPPIPEQRKIASILTTVDSLIEQTEALIEKYRRVKQGMMADLLSRGVDAYGKLRPTQQQAPELYKQSELGWIPMEWEAVRLDDVAQRGSGHTPDRKIPAYWNGGVKWVSLADSSSLDQLFISETEYNISNLGLANSSAVKHPPGTVVLSRDAGIGKSAILGDVMAVSQHFMAWRAGESMNHFYLYYWMQHGKPRFEAIAMGSTIKTIGLSFFRRLRIALPPKSEQDFAAKSLFSLDERLFGLQEDFAKLRTLKTGLMQDLLTGKVRVKVNEDEEVTADV